MPGTAREPSLLVDEDYRITLVTKDYGQPGDLSQSKVAGNQMSGVVQGVCHNKMGMCWFLNGVGSTKDLRKIGGFRKIVGNCNLLVGIVHVLGRKADGVTMNVLCSFFGFISHQVDLKI
jgi:hypothetical protein